MKPGLGSIIIALMLTGWINMSRIVRAQVLKLKDQEFVLAARTLGVSNRDILFKEIFAKFAWSDYYYFYVFHTKCDFLGGIFSICRSWCSGADGLSWFSDK